MATDYGRILEGRRERAGRLRRARFLSNAR